MTSEFAKIRMGEEWPGALRINDDETDLKDSRLCACVCCDHGRKFPDSGTDLRRFIRMLTVPEQEVLQSRIEKALGISGEEEENDDQS